MRLTVKQWTPTEHDVVCDIRIGSLATGIKDLVSNDDEIYQVPFPIWNVIAQVSVFCLNDQIDLQQEREAIQTGPRAQWPFLSLILLVRDSSTCFDREKLRHKHE